MASFQREITFTSSSGIRYIIYTGSRFFNSETLYTIMVRGNPEEFSPVYVRDVLQEAVKRASSKPAVNIQIQQYERHICEHGIKATKILFTATADKEELKPKSIQGPSNEKVAVDATRVDNYFIIYERDEQCYRLNTLFDVLLRDDVTKQNKTRLENAVRDAWKETKPAWANILRVKLIGKDKYVTSTSQPVTKVYYIITVSSREITKLTEQEPRREIVTRQLTTKGFQTTTESRIYKVRVLYVHRVIFNKDVSKVTNALTTGWNRALGLTDETSGLEVKFISNERVVNDRWKPNSRVSYIVHIRNTDVTKQGDMLVLDEYLRTNGYEITNTPGFHVTNIFFISKNELSRIVSVIKNEYTVLNTDISSTLFNVTWSLLEDDYISTYKEMLIPFSYVVTIYRSEVSDLFVNVPSRTILFQKLKSSNFKIAEQRTVYRISTMFIQGLITENQKNRLTEAILSSWAISNSDIDQSNLEVIITDMNTNYYDNNNNQITKITYQVGRRDGGDVGFLVAPTISEMNTPMGGAGFTVVDTGGSLPLEKKPGTDNKEFWTIFFIILGVILFLLLLALLIFCCCKRMRKRRDANRYRSSGARGGKSRWLDNMIFGGGGGKGKGKGADGYNTMSTGYANNSYYRDDSDRGSDAYSGRHFHKDTTNLIGGRSGGTLISERSGHSRYIGSRDELADVRRRLVVLHYDGNAKSVKKDNAQRVYDGDIWYRSTDGEVAIRKEISRVLSHTYHENLCMTSISPMDVDFMKTQCSKYVRVQPEKILDSKGVDSLYKQGVIYVRLNRDFVRTTTCPADANDMCMFHSQSSSHSEMYLSTQKRDVVDSSRTTTKARDYSSVASRRSEDIPVSHFTESSETKKIVYTLPVEDHRQSIIKADETKSHVSRREDHRDYSEYGNVLDAGLLPATGGTSRREYRHEATSAAPRPMSPIHEHSESYYEQQTTGSARRPLSPGPTPVTQNFEYETFRQRTASPVRAKRESRQEVYESRREEALPVTRRVDEVHDYSGQIIGAKQNQSHMHAGGSSTMSSAQKYELRSTGRSDDGLPVYGLKPVGDFGEEHYALDDTLTRSLSRPKSEKVVEKRTEYHESSTMPTRTHHTHTTNGGQMMSSGGAMNGGMSGGEGGYSYKMSMSSGGGSGGERVTREEYSSSGGGGGAELMSQIREGTTLGQVSDVYAQPVKMKSGSGGQSYSESRSYHSSSGGQSGGHSSGHSSGGHGGGHGSGGHDGMGAAMNRNGFEEDRTAFTSGGGGSSSAHYSSSSSSGGQMKEMRQARI